MNKHMAHLAAVAWANGGTLREADLSGANLSGADLYGADLREANLLTRPILAGELDHTDRVANIVQDMEAGFVLAELTLDEARSFRPSGAEILAGIRGRQTAETEAGQ